MISVFIPEHQGGADTIADLEHLRSAGMSTTLSRGRAGYIAGINVQSFHPRSRMPHLSDVAFLALKACSGASPDPRGVERGETLPTAQATKERSHSDQALFTAGLSSIASDAQVASARNAETMGRITAALAKMNERIDLVHQPGASAKSTCT